jgi:4'-phosphopantetheinyl transferase
MSIAGDTGHVPITRWYIDTRPLHPDKSRDEVPLPLLPTVSAQDQQNITRFMQAKDKLMSLASTLLKYLFIHRTAQIPWSEVTISRWPAPHKRPYWSPPSPWPGTFGLEFNVSHQAGLTALIGCKTPDKTSSSQPDIHFDIQHNGATPTDSISAPKPRLGVDITCTSESHRGPKKMTNSAEFAKWVDIFAEMFSARERHDMQHAPTTITTSTTDSTSFPHPRLFAQDTNTNSELSLPTEEDHTLAKLRRFYTYWSLKEAYIKMAGEGLLASWLRELEFTNVISPPLPPATASDDSWGPLIRSATNEDHSNGFGVSLRQQPVADVAMSLISYGSSFIIATAMKGISQSSSDLEPEWCPIDIEQEIRPCAEGRCACPLLR